MDIKIQTSWGMQLQCGVGSRGRKERVGSLDLTTMKDTQDEHMEIAK
jgi:hypothetical protein